MARLAIIADDLTGAADTAAPFARQGLVTMILLSDGPLSDADVLAVSTDTREGSASEAAARTRSAALRLGPALRSDDECWIYKKIDSTLRGHPGVELRALMQALGLERVLAAPAFPAQGRTTVNGRQHVDGQPLEATPFAEQVASSDFGRVLSDSPLPVVQRISVPRLRSGEVDVASAGAGIIVADAETDADLALVIEAATTAGIRLLCGSAGLAQALAGTIAIPAEASAPVLPSRPAGPALIVAASRHPATAAQVHHLRDLGLPVVTPTSDLFQFDSVGPTQLIDRLANELAAGRHTVLTTIGLPTAPIGAAAVAERLAAVVASLCAIQEPSGLILTGGAIAAAVSRALEARALWLRGEVEPGVPWGRLIGGMVTGMPVVTKAGGFGHTGTLEAALQVIASSSGRDV